MKLQIRRFLPIVVVLFTVLWPGMGLAHPIQLGSMEGQVDGNVIHLKVTLPDYKPVDDTTAFERLARRMLYFENNGRFCRVDLGNIVADVPTVMTFDAVCADPIRSLNVHSEFLLDQGYYLSTDITRRGVTRSIIFDEDTVDARFDFGLDTWRDRAAEFFKTVVRFVWMGMTHIYSGYDHILFVLALILVTVRVWDLVKTVTAFTVAHSVTLILSTLNVVRISPHIVEPMIAFSIAYVAFEDIIRDRWRSGSQMPFHSCRWLVAFGFGLFHGLGFSGALQAVNIPRALLIPSLISFNIGVEIAQITIIAVTVPALYFLSRYQWRQRFVHAVLALIGLLGANWFVQRLFLK